MRTLLLATTLLIAGAAASHAQNVAWVDPVNGSGSTCSAALPCAQLQTALDMVADASIIYLRGMGPVGVATLTKSVRIQGSDGAHITGLTINATGKRVVLKNVSFDKANTAGWGIRVVAADSLSVEDASFTNSDGGLEFGPSQGGSLSLKNVNFADSSSGAGAAIRILTKGRNVNVSLDNVSVFAGVSGLVVDATTAGFVKVSVKDTTFTNIGGPAVYATSAAGYARLYLDNVTAVNNNYGLWANGAQSIAWLGSSTIAGNAIGVQRTNSGNIQSYKDNYIFNNTTEGTPLPDSWYTPQMAPVTGNVARADGR